MNRCGFSCEKPNGSCVCRELEDMEDMDSWPERVEQERRLYWSKRDQWLMTMPASFLEMLKESRLAPPAEEKSE